MGPGKVWENGLNLTRSLKENMEKKKQYEIWGGGGESKEGEKILKAPPPSLERSAKHCCQKCVGNDPALVLQVEVWHVNFSGVAKLRNLSLKVYRNVRLCFCLWAGAADDDSRVAEGVGEEGVQLCACSLPSG